MRVEILTDRPEDRFVPGRVLHREGTMAPLTILSAEPVADGPGWRLEFAEIRSRNAAEGLRDAWLETVVDRTADLRPGEAYWHEVIGAEVRGLDGTVLGTVADVYRVATAEVLVVRGGPSGEFDLPLVKDIVRTFAPDEIVVDAAVLDLEAPPVDEPVVRPSRKRPRWSRHGKGGSATPAGPTPAGPTPAGDGAADLEPGGV